MFWKIIQAEFFHYTSLTVWTLGVASVIAVRRWPMLTPPFRLLALWLFFSFLIECCARVARQVYHNNLPLYHLYTLGELLLFSFFYQKILDKKAIPSRHFTALTVIFTFLVLYNSLFIQYLNTINSYSKTLVQLVLIWYSVDFAFTFEEEKDRLAHYRELRLINSGALLYFCASLFIFLFSRLASVDQEKYLWMWDLNMVLHLIFVIMVAVAMYRTAPKST